MITVNNICFYKVPGHCGTCPALVTGNTQSPLQTGVYSRGHCLLWNEWHHTWANTPRRCARLLTRAFARYDNSNENLVITTKEND